MTTASDFLREICRTPEDVAPRLLYADFLDETGDVDRAEMIRVQCALADMRCRPACDHRYRPPANPPLPTPKCPGCRYGKKLDALRRREKDLFDRLGADPFAWLPDLSTVTIQPPLDGGLPCGLVRRGLVEAIHLSAALWLEHADAILATAPVLEVTLTTEMDWHVAGFLEASVRLTAGGVERRCVRATDGCWWGEYPPMVLRILEAEWPRIAFTLPEGRTSREAVFRRFDQEDVDVPFEHDSFPSRKC